MKQFKDLNEARYWFRKYRPFDMSNWKHKTDGYFYGHEDKPKMGDWVLFQHIMQDAYIDGEYQYTISRPILALCIGHDVWDQALTFDFVEDERPYIWNRNLTIPVYRDGELSHTNTLAIAFFKEIENIVFWSDDMNVLGQWKYKPTWRELKAAYKNLL